MTLPVDFSIRAAIWDKSAGRYMALGVGLVVIGVLASSAVTIFTELLDKNQIKVLGFAAATCTALIAAFNPLEIGFAFRDAWRLLDSAILRYNADQTKYPIESVLDAVDKGEAIIASRTRVTSKPPERSPSSTSSAPVTPPKNIP